MTSTLYFYKLPINLLDKNFVLESIETYLATLTPVTKTNFQYQRFDLEKTIKVNLSQDYQLNINAITKYNYLKVTTQDSSSPAKTATYYYFIKKARQVSESTIEFSVEMDTLNTFNFSSTASNKTYTLSNKSLIQREHKDRLVKLPTQYVIRKRNSIESYISYELELNGTATNLSQDEMATFIFNTDGIKTFMSGNSLTSLSISLQVSDGAYIQHNETIYNNVDHIIFSVDGLLDVMELRDSDDNIIAVIPIGNIVEHLYLIMPVGSTITGSFITPGALDWDIFCQNAFYNNGVDIQEHKYKRVIDYYQEGLSTLLFKKNEVKLLDEDGENHWYVLYTSSNAVTDNNYTNYINPVKIRFYNDTGYSISAVSSREVTLYCTSPLIPKWNNTSEKIVFSVSTRPVSTGLQYIKVNGVTYDFYDYSSIIIKRKNNNDILFEWLGVHIWGGTDYTYPQHNFDSVIFYGINRVVVYGDDDVFWNYESHIDINSGPSSYTGTADKWEDLDLTDSRFIKAFAFPYAPCSFMVGEDTFNVLPEAFSFSADDYIQLDNVQKYEFKYQKRFEVASPLANLNVFDLDIGSGKARNIQCESKLFHSDYFIPKLVYDSFAFPFNLENVNVDEVNSSYLSLDNEFYLTYAVSRNVQSKFLFIFDEYALKKSYQDYDNILCIERNNEKALYNNSYINYIKSGGYSYDQKKASSQNAVNGVSTALTIAGAGASLIGGLGSANPVLLGAGVGLAITGITSVMRSVHTAQEQDRAIAQKINQNVMQGTSVQGSEDIDILTAFSGNKAKLVYYELSDIMKNAMWDLFHYCGYATHEQKVPSVDTRLYFNFVQGEIILKDYTFNDDIALRIIQKWKEGVTFMHLVNSTYDFNQEYENFETSLL